MKQLVISVSVLLCSAVALVVASHFSVSPEVIRPKTPVTGLDAVATATAAAETLQYPDQDDPRVRGMVWIPAGVYTMGAADS